MVLLAGTRTSPSSRRTSSSRILRAPQCGFLGLELGDQRLELLRELIGVAHGPPGAIAERLKPVLLVAIENLIAGLTGYPELPAHIGHGFPIQKPGDETKALFHYRTRFPRHQHLPQNKSGKCNPCVRYVLSPMSRAAQKHLAAVRGASREDENPACTRSAHSWRSVGR